MTEKQELYVLVEVLRDWVIELTEADVTGVNIEGREAFIHENMGVPDETMEELLGVCSVESLQCEGEPVTGTDVLKRQEHLKKVPQDVHLSAVAAAKNAGRVFRQYKRLDEPVIHVIKNLNNFEEEFKIASPDLLLNVQVFLPYDLVGKHGHKAMVLEGEYQVLGQQQLTSFRDKISCPSDKVVIGEFSENPAAPREAFSKDIYKSGFFFIENIFYDDMRDDSAIRYSQEIMDWSQKPGRGIDVVYQQMAMETVRFIDLSIKMGKPYLYQHQGNCEHLFVFTDIKLVNPDDCHDIREYPLKVADPKKAILWCVVCQSEATWTSVGFKHSPDYMSYYCDTCFHAFHYDVQGAKISEFEAYPIVQ